jgi:hypothetical protein
VRGWFSAKLGSKISDGSASCQHNFLGHQQPQGHNKQESTTFILPYGSNKQHCMDKEEFHWVFGVLWGWFSAKLGSKISDGSAISCQHNFLGHQQPQGQNKQESKINHFYSSIWIQQTALYGQGRVSLGLWCPVGLVFSKTWVKNQKSVMDPPQFPWSPTANSHRDI